MAPLCHAVFEHKFIQEFQSPCVVTTHIVNAPEWAQLTSHSHGQCESCIKQCHPKIVNDRTHMFKIAKQGHDCRIKEKFLIDQSSNQPCSNNVPHIDPRTSNKAARSAFTRMNFQTARQNAEFIVTGALCCPQTSKHLVQRMPPNSITREYVFVIIRPHLKRPAAPTQCNTNEVLLM